jgi:hypothetical protein
MIPGARLRHPSSAGSGARFPGSHHAWRFYIKVICAEGSWIAPEWGSF